MAKKTNTILYTGMAAALALYFLKRKKNTPNNVVPVDETDTASVENDVE